MTVANPYISACYGALKRFSYSGNDTLIFYGVQSEKITKSAGQIEMPIPTLDSNEKIVMDLMGASLEIIVEGIVTTGLLGEKEGTGDLLYQYAQDLAGLGTDSLIFGNQEDSCYGNYDYTPEILNRGFLSEGHIQFHVVVTDVSIERIEGETEVLHYTVTMKEHKYNVWGCGA